MYVLNAGNVDVKCLFKHVKNNLCLFKHVKNNLFSKDEASKT